MKILVLGAGGMAGHVIATFFKERNYDVSTLSATKKLDEQTILLNLCDIKVFEEYLKQHTFDVVINCVGLLIQQCETQKDLAIFINSYIPHYLETFYKDTQTKVIHLSTDCVFSGKNAPYYENSICDGELFYDKVKALGEIKNNKDLTFRMSIIGPDMSVNGIGLFNWFMKQKGETYGFTTAIWNGITTIELAKAIEKAIEQDLKGLYHLVPNENISKYDLLRLFKEVFTKDDLEIIPKEVESIDKTLINTRQDFKFDVSSYPQMIAEMKEWVNKHEELYSHYL